MFARGKIILLNERDVKIRTKEYILFDIAKKI